MSPLKAALYVLGGLVGLLVVSALVSAIFAAIALLWLLARVLAMLVVFGLVGYAGYKMYGLVAGRLPDRSADEPDSADVGTFDTSISTRKSDRGSPGRSSRDSPSSADAVERLKRQYARGELTEAELERRLERRLDDPAVESLESERE